MLLKWTENTHCAFHEHWMVVLNPLLVSHQAEHLRPSFWQKGQASSLMKLVNNLSSIIAQRCLASIFTQARVFGLGVGEALWHCFAWWSAAQCFFHSLTFFSSSSCSSCLFFFSSSHCNSSSCSISSHHCHSSSITINLCAAHLALLLSL